MADMAAHTVRIPLKECLQMNDATLEPTRRDGAGWDVNWIAEQQRVEGQA